MCICRNFFRFNRWLKKNSELLGAWSSFLQIFVIFLLVITVSLFQLKEFLYKADLHLEFSQPQALTFTVENKNSTLAKKPSYGFGILDLNSDPVNFVPVPWKETNYLRGKSAQGPNALMSKYGKESHRYFGFAKVTCENCKFVRHYWIHIIHGDKNGGWYVEINKNEPRVWNPQALMSQPDEYIENNFPKNRRITIK